MIGCVPGRGERRYFVTRYFLIELEEEDILLTRATTFSNRSSCDDCKQIADAVDSALGLILSIYDRSGARGSDIKDKGMNGMFRMVCFVA